MKTGLDVRIKSELENGGQSYDIMSDMEVIGSHRRRSNTAQRLDRLKKERKHQAKVKVIQWKDKSDGVPTTDTTPSDTRTPKKLTEEELNELFPVKDLSDKRPSDDDVRIKQKVKSVLSDQISKFPRVPNNPFNDYSKFDGRILVSSSSSLNAVRRIQIYLTMLPKPECDYPMDIMIISNARVIDLIGFICWQFFNENKNVSLMSKLSNDINRYSLRIAEETGDVDPDFPSLNPKEPVSKFGFPILALVQKDDDEMSADLTVTVYV